VFFELKTRRRCRYWSDVPSFFKVQPCTRAHSLERRPLSNFRISAEEVSYGLDAFNVPFQSG
jgi:hypothetical protein